MQLNIKTIVGIQLLLLSTMMLNSNIHLPSFVRLGESFHTSEYLIQLAFIINPFVAAVTSITYGFLSDRYGRKFILSVSIFIFLVGTIICPLSTHIETFFLGRFFQSLGDSGIAVVAGIIIGCYYQGSQYAKLQALLSVLMSSAWALSPLLGALCLTYLDWQANFIIIAGALLILIVPLFYWRKEELKFCNFPLISSKDLPQSFFLLMRDKRFLILTLAHALPIGIFAAFEINSPLIFIKHLGYSPREYSVINFGIVFINIISSLIYIKLINHINIAATLSVGVFCFILYIVLSSILILFPETNNIFFTVILFSSLAFTTPFIVSTFTTKILQAYSSQLALACALIAVVRNIATTGISFLTSCFSEGNLQTVLLITFIPSILALWLMIVGRRTA